MYFIIKRFLDILISLIAIILFSPIFVAISLVVLITSGSPVFFCQERMGKNWEPFKIIKFRTMINDADKFGPGITRADDKRVTRFGKVLRKFKLDELPQFLNVLAGNMSLIGPRPELSKYVNYYKDDYLSILKLKPGITDYAAIKFKDEENLIVGEDQESVYVKKILPSKILLYKKYIDEISFSTDIKILFNTLKGLLL